MTALHRQEKNQLKKLFQQEHIDKFEDRYTVIETFLRTESHLTTGELVQTLNANGHPYATDFVRDTLKMMCRYGFAQKNRFDNGQIRYEHRHLGQHHDHIVCIKCRKIMEFENEKLEHLQEQIASAHGFIMLQHKMDIYGICSECLNNRVRVMPLNMAKPGERLVIHDFTGGTTARLRLLTMGLRIGEEMEVISNIGQGQLVVALSGSRFVLGRGLAEKIRVKPLSASVPSEADTSAQEDGR